MLIGLICIKDSSKMEALLHRSFDNIDIRTYNSTDDFFLENSSRTLKFDRFLISMNSDVTSNAENLNRFITDKMPASQAVLISPSAETVQLLRDVFISPNFLFVLAQTVSKQQALLELVSKSINDLRKAYGVIKDAAPVTRPLGDVSLFENKTQAPSGKRKSGGIFALFGKKEQKKQEQVVPNIQDVQPVQETVDINLSIDHYGGDLGVGVNTNLNADLSDFNETEHAEQELESEIEDFNSASTEEELDLSDFEHVTVDSNEFDSLISATPEANTISNPDDAYNFDIPIDDSFDTEFDPSIPVDNSFNDFAEEEIDTEQPVYEESVTEPEPYASGIKKESNDFVVLGVEQPVQEVEEISLLDMSETEKEIETLAKRANELRNKKRDVKPPSVKKVSVANFNSDEALTDAADSTLDVDVESLESVYASDRVKIVERVIERVIPGSQGVGRKNGVRYIIVTGDRRVGMTYTALKLSELMSKKEKTLYVDFDTMRRGSIAYLGLENVLEEPEHVQNGLGHCKSVQMIENVVYMNIEGGYDCLLSMYGNEIEKEQLISLTGIFIAQRNYKTIIIDCPLENLDALKSLLLYSEVIVCVSPDLSSVLATVNSLTSLESLDEYKNFLFSNGMYYMPMSDNLVELKEQFNYVSDVFSLGSQDINWVTMPIRGNIKTFKTFAETL